MDRKHNHAIVPFAKKLRREMTRQERHLWYDFLRGYPVRFSRQKVLGRYIADFYCAQAKLVVELDGSQHFEEIAVEKDTERTKYLETVCLLYHQKKDFISVPYEPKNADYLKKL